MHLVVLVLAVRLFHVEVRVRWFRRYNRLGRCVEFVTSNQFVLVETCCLYLIVVCKVTWILTALLKNLVWSVQYLAIGCVIIVNLHVTIGADVQIAAEVLAVKLLMSFTISNCHRQSSLWLLLQAYSWYTWREVLGWTFIILWSRIIEEHSIIIIIPLIVWTNWRHWLNARRVEVNRVFHRIVSVVPIW